MRRAGSLTRIARGGRVGCALRLLHSFDCFDDFLLVLGAEFAKLDVLREQNQPASRENICASIAVIDQGYGISDTSKLFTRFTRMREEGQPEEDGIGLGLVFVKTVVLRHNGSIDVTSKVAAFEGDTRGTTFSIKLPYMDPPTD